MKRKIIALCLIVAMLGVAVISGTMAYFTDTAEAVNVMTIGSVKIEQIEQQRAEDGKTLVDFVQGKQLVPAVGSIDTYIDLEGTETTSHASAYKFLATKDASGNLKPLANAIDKIVSVENTGRSDAYVRTIFAFEVVEAVSEVEGVDADKTIKFMRNDGKNTDTDDTTPGNSDWTWEWHDQVITVNGQKYALAVVTHEAVLAPKATTIPSLLQIYMKSNVGQEYAAKLGDTYDVLAISQAVQASGFDSAAAALNEAFGAPTGLADDNVTMNAVEWLSKLIIPTVVETADELQAALDAATGTATITLGDDIAGNVTATQKPGVKIVIDGNGKSFDGAITVDGKSARYEDAAITIQNVNFKAAETAIPGDTAFINLGVSGNNNTRYTNNVTVSNCTFDAAAEIRVAAVKSYTGGDKNLTVENCTVSEKIHSLLQVANVEEGLVISGCKVYSKNGINLNYTPTAVISDCTFDVRGYAVRVGVNGTVGGAEKSFTLKNNTMESTCEASDDAVIVIRDNAALATITLENTTLTGTRDILGGTSANIIKK